MVNYFIIFGKLNQTSLHWLVSLYPYQPLRNGKKKNKRYSMDFAFSFHTPNLCKSKNEHLNLPHYRNFFFLHSPTFVILITSTLSSPLPYSPTLLPLFSFSFSIKKIE